MIRSPGSSAEMPVHWFPAKPARVATRRANVIFPTRLGKSSRLLAAVAALSLAPCIAQATSIPVTSGLMVHVAADDIDNNSGTAPTAGTVTAWKNLSTDGASIGDFSGTGAVVLNELNGLPVVRFNGTSNQFENATDVANTAASDLTIFAVADSNDANAGGIFQFRDANASGWLFRYQNETGALYGHAGSSPNITAAFSNDFHLLVLARDGLNVTLSVDGAAGASNTVAGYIASPTSASTRIGTDRFSTGDSYLAGDIAEIIVYNRPLSLSEINQVGYYLEAKYGLNTAFVPEPSSISMLLFGCAMPWLASRKRRRQ